MTMDGDPATGQLDSPPTAKFNSKKKGQLAHSLYAQFLVLGAAKTKKRCLDHFFKKMETTSKVLQPLDLGLGQAGQVPKLDAWRCWQPWTQWTEVLPLAT